MRRRAEKRCFAGDPDVNGATGSTNVPRIHFLRAPSQYYANTRCHAGSAVRAKFARSTVGAKGLMTSDPRKFEEPNNRLL